jgi:hypothetical protein
MTLHTTPTGGPNFPTVEPALPVLVKSKEDTRVPLPGEKSTGSDESPIDTDSPGEAEFKEGGYGWSVVLKTSRNPSLPLLMCVPK